MNKLSCPKFSFLRKQISAILKSSKIIQKKGELIFLRGKEEEGKVEQKKWKEKMPRRK